MGTSIQKIVRSQMLMFALLPLVVTSVFILGIFLLSSLEQAQLTANWQARNAAIEARQQLGELERLLTFNARARHFQLLPIAAGNAGPAIKQLQQLVINYPFLTGAIVLDDQHRLVEAYPFSLYAVTKSQQVWMHQRHEPAAREALAVKSSLLQQSPDSGMPAPLLLLSTPLILEQNSFAHPYRMTGELVFVIALPEFLTQLNNSLSGDDSSWQLGIRSGEQLLLQSTDRAMINPLRFTGFSPAFTHFTEGNDNLVFEASESALAHLAPVLKGLAVVTLVALLIALMLRHSARAFRQTINEPLNHILAICDNIANGRYTVNIERFELTEFESMHKALNKMSVTILEQMTTITEEKEKAQSSEKAKAQFLATMSHEIRTPINGVLGMLTLLEKSELSEHQAKQARLARISAASLLNLINDILDFSKIEANRLELEIIEFNLREMLESAVDMLRVRADENNVRLTLDTSAMMFNYALGDEGRIRQILLNIVGNAIKFTSNGDVTLKVKFGMDANNRSQLAFDVIDTGIGMSEDQLAHVFDSFTQADASTTRKFGGTGLGLTISRQLIQLMGGNIQVESEKARGSHFSITLPIQPVASLENAGQTQEKYPLASRGEKSHKGMRVLLVEDNEINQEVVIGLLETSELMLQVAADGREALAILQSQPPFQLILMDCNMPHMDGYEATRQIRHNPAYISHREVPIVALTANAFAEDREKCRAAGMDDFMTKPLDEHDFFRCIHHWLNNHDNRTRDPHRDSESVSDTVADTPSTQAQMWDRSAALKRVRNKEDRLIKLIQMFLDGMPERLAAIEQAFAHQDSETIRSMAHTAKGVAGNLGAEILMHLAHVVELQARSGELQGLDNKISEMIAASAAISTEFERYLQQHSRFTGSSKSHSA